MLQKMTTPPIPFGRRDVAPIATAVAGPDVSGATRGGVAAGLWRSSIAWCVLGFVLGAPFWHLIGFWGFLTTTAPIAADADRARATSEASVAARPNRAATSPLRSAHPGRKGQAHLALAGCTALVLDRASGATLPAGCKANAPALADGVAAVRGDLLAQSWPLPGPRTGTRFVDLVDADQDTTTPWHVTVIDVQAAADRAP